MENSIEHSSNVSPLGLLVLVVMCVLTCRLRRQNALMPLLITTCYIPLGQEFVIAGLNLQFFRILLLVGLCRAWSRRETVGLSLTTMDKLFISWALVTMVVGTFADLSISRFTNRAGAALNAAAVYFLVRCWMRTFGEVVHVVRLLAVMIVPLAISMLMEKSTGRNIFAVFGGVPELTEVRDGHLRCQGAFRHPILAGTYGATAFPLFVGLWCQGGRDRRRAIIGAIAAMIVTVAAGSSGAVLALIGEVTGLALWRIRFQMRLVRRGLLVILVLLALVMKAPVWYLFARVSEVAGGTGWYRSYLIEQAVNHFNEWWLVGTAYTAHWAPSGEIPVGNPNHTDMVNHFVAEGVDGGILKLGLFVAMIVIGFKTVGRWIWAVGDISMARRFFTWSLGGCLLGHCLAFMSVTYFDQIVVMWYWLLAMMAMLGGELQILHNSSRENSLCGGASPDAETVSEPQPVQLR